MQRECDATGGVIGSEWLRLGRRASGYLLRGHRVHTVDKHTQEGVTLPRDSVGSPQIRADAVRSPEIKAEAVRSSEIEDNGVRLADISDGARVALQGPHSVRLAEADSVAVPTCDTILLTTCLNVVSLTLPPGNWLVQAKFSVVGSAFGLADRCGLIEGAPSDPKVVDKATAIGLGVSTGAEDVTLADVMTTGLTTVALRCTEGSDAFLTVRDVKLTALEVETVFGP
jgi:hypothetical protein